MTNEDFRIYVPLQKSNLKLDEDGKVQLNPDGTLDIEGIASTTNVDLQKDIILPSAIESMKNQLLTRNINLHGDHDYSLDGVLGPITKVFDSGPDKLHIGGKVLRKHAPRIAEMLNNNVALGYSIGGKPTKYTKNNVGGYGVEDLNLYEISLTPFPANMDTLGTVRVAKTGTVEGRCFAGVCNKIIKNMNFEEKNNMPTDNNNASAPEDVDAKIKATVDELWAEKEQGLIDSITESIEQRVKDIVKEEMGDKKDENPEDNKDDEANDVSKSIDMDKFMEQMQKSMSEYLDETFGEFKKQFFKQTDENREPQSNVNLSSGPVETKKTFTTRETAEILMKNQRSVDPIMNAVMKNMQ